MAVSPETQGAKGQPFHIQLFEFSVIVPTVQHIIFKERAMLFFCLCTKYEEND